jgi:hypothetical protein
MRNSPELVDRLTRSADETRHQIVERACWLAVQQVDLAIPKLAEAPDAIRRRRSAISILHSRSDALPGYRSGP